MAEGLYSVGQHLNSSTAEAQGSLRALLHTGTAMLCNGMM